MAVYVYKCDAKRPHVEEVSQKMSEAPLVVCPHKDCGRATRRVIVGSNIIYRGNDWTRKADREF